MVVDEVGQPRSRAHIDLALLDLVIAEVVQVHRQDIDCWRIHRRYGDHEFRLDTFCADAEVGRNIQREISTHEFVVDLQNAQIITSILAELGPATKEDIGERVWPPEIRMVWPNFAQSLTETLIGLVQYLRVASTGSPTIQDIRNRDIAEQLDFYAQLQQHIDQSWGQFGSHGFVHHIHSFFAYAPFSARLVRGDIIYDIR